MQSRPQQCHCFVMGLLVSPSGLRILFRRSYSKKEYCLQKKRADRKQMELAAEMIRELPLPDAANIVFLGDTAFDAEVIRDARDARNYFWIVPINPERVLAGESPRPNGWSLAKGLTAKRFKAVRLQPGQGRHAASVGVSAGASRQTA